MRSATDQKRFYSEEKSAIVSAGDGGSSCLTQRGYGVVQKARVLKKLN